MGSEHAVVQTEPPLPGYTRLEGESGAVVRHAPALERRSREVLAYLEAGLATLPYLLGSPAPDFEALVVSGEDWDQAPRDRVRPYPPGLPYFTRTARTPTLVIPEELSEAIQPRTPATLPLVIYHELAHAFLAGRVATDVPAWLRELPPQVASAAVARREKLPLGEHLAGAQSPNFTIRGFSTPASAEEQMAFQNLLLGLGAAALAEFGEDFLWRLIESLKHEQEVGGVGAESAERFLVDALGDGGREWLDAREEF